MATYTVFKRSARNWKEFATARKQLVRGGLTYEKALAMCEEFNEHRTPAQKRRGTKYEFTSDF